jgi:hemerythrin superfamily protein
MNAIAARMSPTITNMIRMDHAHVMAVFHRYKADTPSSKKQALITNACLALQVHAQLEEEIFYPALREVMTGDEVLDKSESEHDQMRGLISELRAATGGDGAGVNAAYDDKFMELMRIVIHHVADEETRLLPAAERLLAHDLSRLGAEMTHRRMELLRPHKAELAASTVRSFPGAAAGAGAALLTLGGVAIGAMLMSRRKRGGQERTQSRWS